MPVEAESRCGVVALAGAPNAGKSTLVNALVGQKVAIVSPRAQTTRQRLTGVAIEGNAQLLLVDTPGLFAPRRRLDRMMVGSAREGVADADLVLLVVDCIRPQWGVLEDEAFRHGGRVPCWLVLNKIDLAAPARLLELEQHGARLGRFQRWFSLSASEGTGVAALKEALAQAMPAGPWLFPEDQLSDVPVRLMAAELVREQIFRQLGQELPYRSAVHCEKFEERDDGSVAIHAQILVDRASQKPIVLGAGGSRIRSIGEQARREMADLLGRRVHLFLHVKVRPGWADDRHSWRDLGLAWTD